MHITNQMEQFSIAYVKAIAAQAGVNPYKYDVDDDSIDIGFAIKDNKRSHIGIQLKCTGKAVDPNKEAFPFDLPIKNYNDLRGETTIPRLLVVVCVPENTDEWTKQTEEELCLRHCGYWCSLEGMPETENKTSVRIQIPRKNIFSVDFLKNAIQGEAGELS